MNDVSLSLFAFSTQLSLLKKIKRQYKGEPPFPCCLMTPITNELIAEIIRRLVASLNPEEIILFGSYAWGAPHQYSDLDLCVIFDDDIPEFDRIEWGVRALNVLDDLLVDVDILIKTRLDVETFKTVPASLTRKIVESGKLLYGRNEKQLAKVRA